MPPFCKGVPPFTCFFTSRLHWKPVRRDWKPVHSPMSPMSPMFQVRRWNTRLRKGNIMLRTTFGYVRCSARLYRDVGSSQPAEPPEPQPSATPQRPTTHEIQPEKPNRVTNFLGEWLFYYSPIGHFILGQEEGS